MFITLSLLDFEKWAEERWEGDYDITFPKFGREAVIRHITKKGGLEYHIYTSVDDGQTRAIGEDAIRVILYDSLSGKMAFQAKKVLRTEGATSVFDRLDERVNQLDGIVSACVSKDRFCKKCGSHTIKRTNKKTNQEFYGCGAFPHCGDRTWAKNNYPLITNDQTKPVKELPFDIKPKDSFDIETVVEEEKPYVEIIKVNEQDELVATSDYPYHQYAFEYFNPVQSLLLKEHLHEKDANVILGTTTSSGKTIAAELVMGYVLNESAKKVLYTAPLKALSSEKLEEWSTGVFKDRKITMLTGDTLYDEKVRKKQMEEASKSDIIIATSELVDSLTRNYCSEQYMWIHEIVLVIVDEAHIIHTNRGHAVETGLMRFSKLVPEAKILFLSATLPNVGEFKEWLSILNNKNTEVINSTWRPTKLEWHFVPHITMASYAEMEFDKKRKVLEILQENPNEKHLIFTHSKTTGRSLTYMIQEELGETVHFYNADLNRKDRNKIEASFKDRENGLRIITATSALAWGVNLPARNVIIVGTKRGLEEVETMDIIQMAGRAGRYGIDDQGDVFFICDNVGRWQAEVNSPPSVESSLMNKGILGFHILAEVRNGEIWNRETLVKWFDRTLAKIQKPIDEDLLTTVVQKLVDWYMLRIENDIYKITALGQVSAALYYLPQDIHHLAMWFNEVDREKLWNSDLMLSYVLGTIPSASLNYVPRNEQERVQDYSMALRGTYKGKFQIQDSLVAADLYDYLCGDRGSPSIRNLQVDADRLAAALEWIDGIKSWMQRPLWKSLPMRIKYGVSAEMIELVSLPGIGATRAKKLHAAGITNLRAVVSNADKVRSMLGAIGENAVATARVKLRQDQ